MLEVAKGSSEVVPLTIQEVRESIIEFGGRFIKMMWIHPTNEKAKAAMDSVEFIADYASRLWAAEATAARLAKLEVERLRQRVSELEAQNKNG